LYAIGNSDIIKKYSLLIDMAYFLCFLMLVNTLFLLYKLLAALIILQG